MIRLPERTAAPSLLADLTPLLDVIFIILVFFLLTAQVPLLELPMRLPTTDAPLSAGTAQTERLQLALHADGSWLLDQQRYASLQALREGATLEPQQGLDIAVESGAGANDLLRLLSWLQGLGVTDTRLLMEQAHAE